MKNHRFDNASKNLRRRNLIFLGVLCTLVALSYMLGMLRIKGL